MQAGRRRRIRTEVFGETFKPNASPLTGFHVVELTAVITIFHLVLFNCRIVILVCTSPISRRYCQGWASATSLDYVVRHPKQYHSIVNRRQKTCCNLFEKTSGPSFGSCWLSYGGEHSEQVKYLYCSRRMYSQHATRYTLIENCYTRYHTCSI